MYFEEKGKLYQNFYLFRNCALSKLNYSFWLQELRNIKDSIYKMNQESFSCIGICYDCDIDLIID